MDTSELAHQKPGWKYGLSDVGQFVQYVLLNDASSAASVSGATGSSFSQIDRPLRTRPLKLGSDGSSFDICSTTASYSRFDQRL